MNRNSFDIVIPTYNREGFIERAINSVINQKYTDWNLYILDNASTDNTENFVKQFLSEKIHYVSNDKNIGLVRNWMKSISEIGNEKYVVLLGDDDELGEVFLLKANEAINLFPNLGLYSSSAYIKKGNSTHVWISEYIDTANKVYEVCLPAQNLHYFLGGNPVSPAAMLVKRASLKSITDYNFSYTSAWSFDRYWWAQIALMNTIVFCCEPTATYYQHDKSVSYNISRNNFDQTAHAFCVTAKIINTGYNFDLVTVESLSAELKKLSAQAQLHVLCSLILFGHKCFYDFALIYFAVNNKILLSNQNYVMRIIYRLLGLKLISFMRMYKSRT